MLEQDSGEVTEYQVCSIIGAVSNADTERTAGAPLQ